MPIGISLPSGILNRVIGVFVVITVLVAIVGLFFGGLASLGENLSSVSTGNATVDTILAALVIVVLIAGAFFFLDIAFRAFGKK